MNIIITGGAGFIGSTLARSLLDANHAVNIIDDLSYGEEANLPKHSNLCYYKSDITDASKLKEIFTDVNPDAVAHLAAIAPLPDCQSNPYLAYSVNVGGTINVLEACRYTNVNKIVFASTGAMYENTNIPHREYDNVKPDLIYPMTKYHAEQICKSYVNNYGLDVTMLRLFNVYGVLQSSTRKHPALMGYLINCITNNKPIEFYNNQQTPRDYINVHDVVTAFIELLVNRPDNTKGVSINIGSGTAVSVETILDLFKTYLQDKTTYDFKAGYGNPVEFWDKYSELCDGTYNLNKSRIKHEVIHSTLADNRLAARLLGWKPTIDIQTGVKQICQKL